MQARLGMSRGYYDDIHVDRRFANQFLTEQLKPERREQACSEAGQ